MSSFAHCVTKLGIHPSDRETLDFLVGQHKAEGFSVPEANKRGAADLIRMVQDNIAKIENQVVEFKNEHAPAPKFERDDDLLKAFRSSPELRNKAFDTLSDYSKAELRREAERMLGRRVDLHFLPTVVDGIAKLGAYMDRGINIDPDTGVADAFMTMDHEVLHAVEDLFLTRGERNRLRLLMPEREDRADAIAKILNKKRKPEFGYEHVWEKVKDFLAKIADGVNLFMGKRTEVKSVEELADRIYRGYYAKHGDLSRGAWRERQITGEAGPIYYHNGLTSVEDLRRRYKVPEGEDPVPAALKYIYKKIIVPEMKRRDLGEETGLPDGFVNDDHTDVVSENIVELAKAISTAGRGEKNVDKADETVDVSSHLRRVLNVAKAIADGVEDVGNETPFQALLSTAIREKIKMAKKQRVDKSYNEVALNKKKKGKDKDAGGKEGEGAELTESLPTNKTNELTEQEKHVDREEFNNTENAPPLLFSEAQAVAAEIFEKLKGIITTDIQGKNDATIKSDTALRRFIADFITGINSDASGKGVIRFDKTNKKYTINNKIAKTIYGVASPKTTAKWIDKLTDSQNILKGIRRDFSNINKQDLYTIRDIIAGDKTYDPANPFKSDDEPARTPDKTPETTVAESARPEDWTDVKTASGAKELAAAEIEAVIHDNEDLGRTTPEDREEIKKVVVESVLNDSPSADVVAKIPGAAEAIKKLAPEKPEKKKTEPPPEMRTGYHPGTMKGVRGNFEPGVTPDPQLGRSFERAPTTVDISMEVDKTDAVASGVADVFYRGKGARRMSFDEVGVGDHAKIAGRNAVVESVGSVMDPQQNIHRTLTWLVDLGDGRTGRMTQHEGQSVGVDAGSHAKAEERPSVIDEIKPVETKPEPDVYDGMSMRDLLSEAFDRAVEHPEIIERLDGIEASYHEAMSFLNERGGTERVQVGASHVGAAKDAVRSILRELDAADGVEPRKRSEYKPVEPEAIKPVEQDKYDRMTPDQLRVLAERRGMNIGVMENNAATIRGWLRNNDANPPTGEAGARPDGDGKRSLDPGRETWAQRIHRFFFDRFNAIERLVDMAQRGIKIPDDENPIYAARLYIGRVGSQRADFYKRIYDPNNKNSLISRMIAEGVSDNDLGKYLLAEHAEEANDHYRKLAADRGEIEDAGSGMTDKFAKDYLAMHKNKPVAKFAKEFRKEVIEKRLDMLVKGGMISKEQAAMFRRKYPNYVPLMRDVSMDTNSLNANGNQWLKEMGLASDVDIGGRSGGSGFSASGKDANKRVGSGGLLLHNPFMAAIANYETAIRRVEMNRVGQAFFKMINEFPDSTKFQIVKPDEKTGDITLDGGEFGDINYYDKDASKFYDADLVRAANAKEVGDIFVKKPTEKVEYAQPLEVKFNGQSWKILIKDRAIAQGMKNLGAMEAIGIIKLMRPAMNFIRNVSTIYNPNFVVSNFERDMLDAIARVGGEKGTAMAAKMSGQVASEMGKLFTLRDNVFGGIWNESAGRSKAENHYWSKVFRDYKEDGGEMGFFNGAADLHEMKRNVEKEVRMAQATFATDPGRAMLKSLRAVGDLVRRANESVEMSTRLIVYDNLRKAGASREEAAVWAKNVTVDFNRKGQLTDFFNSLYLFFNASLQGSARFTSSLWNHNGTRAIVGSAAVAGFFEAMLNDMINGDEDRKTRPEERDSYFRVPLGDGKTIVVRLPWGYALGKTTGGVAYDWWNNRTDGWDAAGRLLSSLVTTFSPINALNPINYLPTVVQAPLGTAFNQNAFGSPVHPVESPFDKKPRHLDYFKSNSAASKWVADKLSRAAGGNNTLEAVHAPSLFEWYPGTIDALMGAYTGGAGKSLNSVADFGWKTISGEDADPTTLPIASVFIKNPKVGYERNHVYEILNHGKDHLISKWEEDQFYRDLDTAIARYMIPGQEAYGISPDKREQLIRSFVADQRRHEDNKIKEGAAPAYSTPSEAASPASAPEPETETVKPLDFDKLLGKARSMKKSFADASKFPVAVVNHGYALIRAKRVLDKANEAFRTAKEDMMKYPEIRKDPLELPEGTISFIEQSQSTMIDRAKLMNMLTNTLGISNEKANELIKLGTIPKLVQAYLRVMLDVKDNAVPVVPLTPSKA